MMDFIQIPATVGIIFYFGYQVFELFVHKKERLLLIEKMGINITPLNPEILKAQFTSLLPAIKNKSFGPLRAGCLLLGLGVGLLAGLLIHMGILANSDFHKHWGNLSGVGYGASVLLFGGLGLLISFWVESNILKKKEKEQEKENSGF